MIDCQHMKENKIKVTAVYLGSVERYRITKIVGRPFVYVVKLDEHGRDTEENEVARVGNVITERQAEVLSAESNVEFTAISPA